MLKIEALIERYWGLFAIVVHVVINTQNEVISCCCSAEEAIAKKCTVSVSYVRTFRLNAFSSLFPFSFA